MEDVQLLATIVRRVGAAQSFEEAAEGLTDWAQGLTGCASAMLRFREADEEPGWIPALVQRGLTTRFLQDEALIGADECMCGRVASGQTDPGLPFFTPGGSFVWGRVAHIADEFPPEALGSVRGRCIAEGYDSIGIFPLLGPEGPVGSLHLADFGPEKFDPHTSLLEAACRACGPLLLRYRRSNRRAALRRAVEAALVPREIPAVEGFELAARFRSATPEAEVGGDFYDILDLEARGVFLLVGDYEGSGIEVAGVAARVRQAVSNLARLHDDPAELLRRASEELGHIVPHGRCVTLAACRCSRDGEVLAAVAGHPRPLILGRQFEVEELVVPPNLPVGVADAGRRFSGGTTLLSRDQVLLLFTDGIIEARRQGEFFGVEGITRVWRQAGGQSLEEFTEALCRESERFHADARTQDDRLVLTARRTA